MLSPKIAIAQIGARRHYQQPALLQEWGLLDTFFTDFYAGDSIIAESFRHSAISKYLPVPIQRMSDRYSDRLKEAEIVHFPSFSVKFMSKLRKVSAKNTSDVVLEMGKAFCQSVLCHGIGNANAVYGFNGACLELFEYAKSKGIKCILDQTLAERSYVHQLLQEEHKRWPGWSLAPARVSAADCARAVREHKEQMLADEVVCGSAFVKDSLVESGIAADKISVVPVGRVRSSAEIKQAPRSQIEELRILFAGSVTLRKGIPYLLEALKQIKGEIPFTCKAAGIVKIQPEQVQSYTDVCQFLGAVPRTQMAELYNWADIFVFPSICEGSAMVTYEALSHGLPIITTYNAGSIVSDTPENRVVPIRDSAAIAQAIRDFSNARPDRNICAVQQKALLVKTYGGALEQFKSLLTQNHI